MVRCVYYVVEYVPNIPKNEAAAVCLIANANGEGLVRVRHDFPNDYPPSDIEFFRDLASYLSDRVKEAAWPATMRRLQDSLGNNLQIRGPIESSDDVETIAKKYFCEVRPQLSDT